MNTQISIVIMSICLSATTFANSLVQNTESSLNLSIKEATTEPKNDDKASIIDCIQAFAIAGDVNDAQELSKYLDSNFRIVMNRLFGSTSVDLVNRETYLEMIRTKEWGGDKRDVSIDQVTINGSTAFAKVLLIGEKASMTSLIGLVKDSGGTWKIILDMPVL